ASYRNDSTARIAPNRPIEWIKHMKVLFLDIDGVVNCKTTRRRHRGLMGIDQRLARVVREIAHAVPDLKVVLSPAWRGVEDGRGAVEDKGVPWFDVTICFDADDDVRGYEIQAWLEMNPGVERYAILDDDCDMLPHQMPSLFRTSTGIGITQELADRIVTHLTVASPTRGGQKS